MAFSSSVWTKNVFITSNVYTIHVCLIKIWNHVILCFDWCCLQRHYQKLYNQCIFFCVENLYENAKLWLKTQNITKEQNRSLFYSHIFYNHLESLDEEAHRQAMKESFAGEGYDLLLQKAKETLSQAQTFVTFAVSTQCPRRPLYKTCKALNQSVSYGICVHPVIRLYKPL